MPQSMVVTCMTCNCSMSVNVECVTSDETEWQKTEIAETFLFSSLL